MYSVKLNSRSKWDSFLEFPEQSYAKSLGRIFKHSFFMILTPAENQSVFSVMQKLKLFNLQVFHSSFFHKSIFKAAASISYTFIDYLLGKTLTFLLGPTVWKDFKRFFVNRLSLTILYVNV